MRKRHEICFVSERDGGHRAEHDEKPKIRDSAKLESAGFWAGLLVSLKDID
jgi:hypothetical protein